MPYRKTQPWAGKAPQGTPLDTSNSLNNGLITWYRFSEGAGMVLRDSSGRNNIATFGAAAPAWVRGGKRGPGLHFDNAAFNFVSALNVPDLSGNLTISVRVRSDAATGYTRILHMRDAASRSIQFVFDQDVPTFAVIGNSVNGIGGFPVLVAGPQATPWYDICGTFSNAVLQTMYLNGVVGSYASNGWGQGSGVGFNIGSNIGSGASYWGGWIDDVRVENRILLQSEVMALHDNSQLGLWTPHRRIISQISVGGVQLIVPTSDISTGTWSPSSGGSMYAMLDESVADDGDYIFSGINPSSDTCEVKFGSPTSTPIVTTGHVVRYRIRGEGALGGIDVGLYCGATLIKSWMHSVAPVTETTYQQTLSSGEAATIVDYTDLRLRFTAHN